MSISVYDQIHSICNRAPGKLRKYDQQRIITAIEEQLVDQPGQETRNRKRLRPNQLAEWELRIDAFRVLYDVDTADHVVSIRAVARKRGNRLFVYGEEMDL